MNRVNLTPQERSVFGTFLKDIGGLLCEHKIYDARSAVSIEKSTIEATRVRVEVSFYMNDEVQAVLAKLAEQYRNHI